MDACKRLRDDIIKHKQDVRYLMGIVCNELLLRAGEHDDSKFFDKKEFDSLLKLKNSKFGSDEYVDNCKSARTLTSHKQAIYFKEVVGFKVYDVMIYQKHNFSNPMKKRYHNIYEFMYIFSKGWPRVFNPIKDRKNKYAGQTCWGRNTYRLKDKLKMKEVW